MQIRELSIHTVLWIICIHIILFIPQTLIEYLVCIRDCAPTIDKKMKETVLVIEKLRVGAGAGTAEETEIIV